MYQAAMTLQNDAWPRTWDQVSYLPYTTQLVWKQKCETVLFDSISQSLVFRIRQSKIFNGSLSQDVKRLAISAAPPKPHHLKKRQLEIVLIKEFRRGNVASRHTETPRCVRGGVRVSTFHPGQICLLR